MKTMYFITVLCATSLFSASAFAVKQVELLKRDGEQNEIPLLDNRFRIDSQLDEITLLFFRKPGSPAVILVRPMASYWPHFARQPHCGVRGSVLKSTATTSYVV